MEQAGGAEDPAPPTGVVIVEGIPFVADALRASLAGDAGLRILGVFGDSDGETVEAIVGAAPDVALLDCRAVNPAAIARLHELLPGTRLIAMALHATERERRTVIAAGAGRYISKDYGLAELRRLIHDDIPAPASPG